MSHQGFLDDSTESLESSILYQNPSRTVIIIDIPRSIANAQGPTESARELFSVEPLEEPFAPTEPKSGEARKNVAARNGVDLELVGKYATLIERAIEEVNDSWRSQATGEQAWAHKRRIREGCAHVKGRGRKRKSDELEEIGNGKIEGSSNEVSTTQNYGPINGHQFPVGSVREDEIFFQKEERMQSVMKAVVDQERPETRPILEHPCHIYEARDEFISDEHDRHGGVWHNTLSENMVLSINEQKSNKPSSSKPTPTLFHIPPLSTHILSDCADPSYLRTAVRESLTTTNNLRVFDFILLDPPWPNASAKRKSSYSTVSQLRALKRLLLDMDLDTYIPPSGYVGIWITNAPSVRNLVLGEDGLFEAWNLTLVEEWIWVKTTRYGEPVTSVHGVWRKPYEVLLLGRAPANRLAIAAESGTERVVKRVMFGCPDWHSRKPCLKVLIEGLQMVKRDGRVLEIFARHLVAGWWSWGDEVLKFNWEGYWTEGSSASNDDDSIKNERRRPSTNLEAHKRTDAENNISVT
ncbi:hypothetical protein FKW77_008314 [Venturia effusa]|uniref:MT-A70-domain-containing protein n=1 Tax=Venturia effusa TaxID=50376 RepID=A0A517LG16_9PEZI|nr:hypothetical protein FKW77_008314 [Venturia effusa]